MCNFSPRKVIFMNLHEYQGKSILQKYGVTVQRGVVVDNVANAVEAAKKLTEETGTDGTL